ncbi:MAG TPA: GAF domain-containing protein [candidate division WOR-3 bacterium]|uniref:histidine kinase n=1 Tax=candidate division WOR-3 bacterium TaxID=2052148 RepID=A0A7C0ZIE2_UNCW3|nr:GAF domain-containing protein [candidate division WOR-3 bacterium]
MEIKYCPLPSVELDNDGKIVEHNEILSNILGSDIKGEYLKDFIHPSSLKTYEKLRKGEISRGIVVVYTVDGERDFRLYRIEEEGRTAFVLVDISTEMKLTSLLEKQRDYFTDFLNSLDYGVLIVDNRIKAIGRNKLFNRMLEYGDVDEEGFIDKYKEDLVLVKDSRKGKSFFVRFKGNMIKIQLIPFLHRGVIILLSDANQLIRVQLADNLFRIVVSQPFKKAVKMMVKEIMNSLQIDSISMTVTFPQFEFAAGKGELVFEKFETDRYSVIIGLPEYLDDALLQGVFEDIRLSLGALLNSTILESERNFFHRVFTLSERLLTAESIEEFGKRLKTGLESITGHRVRIVLTEDTNKVKLGKRLIGSESLKYNISDCELNVWLNWEDLITFERRFLLTFLEIHFSRFVHNMKVQNLYRRFANLYEMTNLLFNNEFKKVYKKVLNLATGIGGDYVSLIKLRGDGSGYFVYSTGYSDREIEEINRKLKEIYTPFNKSAYRFFNETMRKGMAYKRVKKGTNIARFVVHKDIKHLYMFAIGRSSPEPYIFTVGFKSEKKPAQEQLIMFSDLAHQISFVGFRDVYKNMNRGVSAILKTLSSVDNWMKDVEEFRKNMMGIAKKLGEIISAKQGYFFKVENSYLKRIFLTEKRYDDVPERIKLSSVPTVKRALKRMETLVLKKASNDHPLVDETDFRPVMVFIPLDIPVLGKYVLVYKKMGSIPFTEDLIKLLSLIGILINTLSGKYASLRKIHELLRFLKMYPEKSSLKKKGRFFYIKKMSRIKSRKVLSELKQHNWVRSGDTIYFKIERSKDDNDIMVLKGLKDEEINCFREILTLFVNSIYEKSRIEEFNSKFISLSKSLKSVSRMSHTEAKEEILKEIVSALDLAYAGLFIRENDYLKLDSFYAMAPQSVKDLRIPLRKDAVTTKAFNSDRPILVQDVERCDFYFEGIVGIKSELAIPITFGDEKLGVLDLGRETKEGFSNLDILFAEDVSHLLSVWLWILLTGEKIIKEERLTSLIMDNITTGLIITDRSGLVLKSNRFIEEWLGENPEGRNIVEYFNQETMKEPLEGRYVDRVVFNFRDMVFGYSGAPMYDESGRIIGGLYIIRDLTEIREMEERIKRQERLAALGEMSAGMAHEIKNPLAAVKAGIEYLMRGVREEEKIESFNLIMKEIDRVDRIVKGMLAYARRPPLRMKEFDICECIEKVLAIYGINSREKNIRVEVHCVGNIIMYGDEDQITEVITNLFLNAVEATPEGGKIWIEIEEKDEQVVIRVSDNGPGISEEVKEKIFNPFFTTRSQGTGLGLSITHRIVTDHGGVIRVENNREGGATFIVILPRRKNG